MLSLELRQGDWKVDGGAEIDSSGRLSLRLGDDDSMQEDWVSASDDEV